MKFKIVSIVFAFSLILASCASIFIPKKQKVTFNTGSSESEVYLDKESIGTGKTFTTKINKKEGQSRQIIIRTKGYKDQYAVIIKTHRPGAYWPLAVLDACTIYPFEVDMLNYYKLTSYDREISFDKSSEDNKLINRSPKDKYIDVSNISMNIKDKNKDLRFIDVVYDKTDLKKAMETAESKVEAKDKKKEEKAAKKKKNKNKKTIDDEEKDIKYGDTKYSDAIYKTLKKTGFIDTVNEVVGDNNNTLVLEGSITKISTYNIESRFASYYKAKIFLTWYVKNTYGEIIDSVKTTEYSGDFSSIYDYSDKDSPWEGWGKMLGDAVDLSYLKLFKNPALAKNLPINKNFKITDAPLSLSKAAESSIVHDRSEAGEACVIVKVKENGKDAGHGSGFAITKDGYILTNYHVIAGRTEKKQKQVFVIDASGKEIPAQIIRYNKFRDVALLKVNNTFDKVFRVDNTKKFKNMQDVYTIGAPKSIQLGQTVSSGLISNLRDFNNNPIIQLNMLVNPGNSGGPVFDTNGNLHGVIRSKLYSYSAGEGISFAVPAYLLQDYLNINFK